VTASSPDSTAHEPGRRAPLPLTLAATLAAVEAVALVVEGLSLLPVMDQDRLTMGVTSLLFFLIYGGALAFCAWQLQRLRSWARAPVVLAQLIQIMVGASFWGGSTTPLAVVIIAVAVVTLVGIFHPASLAALEAEEG
jgi:hypothetical protein